MISRYMVLFRVLRRGRERRREKKKVMGRKISNLTPFNQKHDYSLKTSFLLWKRYIFPYETTKKVGQAMTDFR